VINVRKIAAVDLTFLGERFVIAEFVIAVLGSAALGALTLERARSSGGIAFGWYLLALALNYVPMAVSAIDLTRRRSAHAEISAEIVDRRRLFRKYRRQSLLLLVPLAVPVALIVQAWRARAPLLAFFGTVFGLSWLGGLALYAGVRIAGAAWAPRYALLLYPVLITSVAAAGVALRHTFGGNAGSLELVRHSTPWRARRWYLLVLLPPTLIVAVLETLTVVAGPTFRPNFLLPGFLFGVPAGLLEEIGWSGYAFPRLLDRFSWGTACCVLGALWGFWHLPVVDALAAVPHGAGLPAFFVAFVIVLAAARVIICRAVAATSGILIAQLIHISSTGSLVILGPAHVSPAQEALWYGVYGCCLWLIALPMLAGRGRPKV
jgi:membrane protease YdiL (CAAX protease family)